MKFGVQYYPKHWPQERWAVDAGMMQRAGVTMISPISPRADFACARKGLK